MKPPASVRAHALKLLSRRDWTRRAMLDRLGADGYGPDAAADAVEYLTESGYLDDRRYAERLIASPRAHRGHGRSWLERELESKGVPRDIVKAVLEDGRDQEMELKEVIELAEKILRRDPEIARERLAARLARRGFAWQIVRTALDRLVKETPDGSES